PCSRWPRRPTRSAGGTTPLCPCAGAALRWYPPASWCPCRLPYSTGSGALGFPSPSPYRSPRLAEPIPVRLHPRLLLRRGAAPARRSLLSIGRGCALAHPRIRAARRVVGRGGALAHPRIRAARRVVGRAPSHLDAVVRVVGRLEGSLARDHLRDREPPG